MKVRVAYTVEFNEQDRLALQQVLGGQLPTRNEIQAHLEMRGRAAVDKEIRDGYAKLAATFQQKAGGDGANTQWK
jgi:hypothetical protein